MDASLRIQSVPKGQHEVCVTQDHPRRPIIPGRIRQAGMRMAGRRGCFGYRSMTSGRFLLAGTTAMFRTHCRRCERRSRCGNREEHQSNDPYCGQPGRPGRVVRDAILGHFLSRHRAKEIGVAAEETRCEIALFQTAHSIMWERCTDPLLIQPCIRSAAMNKLKSAPARGGGWDALEAPPAKRPGEFAS